MEPACSPSFIAAGHYCSLFKIARRRTAPGRGDTLRPFGRVRPHGPAGIREGSRGPGGLAERAAPGRGGRPGRSLTALLLVGDRLEAFVRAYVSAKRMRRAN